MNAELIDLYRGVQHRRGEWRVGDGALYFGEFGVIIAISPATGFLTVQHKKGHISGIRPDDPDLLWLPPVWSDDGRCLIGMIERDFSVTRIWYDSDDLTTDDGWIYGVDFIDGEFIGYYNSLPEALLRAIKEQEGKG